MELVTKTIKNLISVKGMAAHKLKVWRGNFQAMKAEAKALAAEAPSNVPPIAENSITGLCTLCHSRSPMSRLRRQLRVCR